MKRDMNALYTRVTHTIKLGLSFLLLLGGACGCSDLLDKSPNSSIADGNFWNNEKDAYMALVGCYVFPSGWTNDDFATPCGQIYLDCCGGNGVEKENFTSMMAGVNCLPTNSNIERFWDNAYWMIAKQNNFLVNVVNCPMKDEQLRAQFISEAKCLRAYYLFYLAFHFKNVPMPLTNLTLGEANTISQTSQSEVYNQLESDLREAIDVLPDRYDASNYGRFTRNAARVLLSRIYLAQDRWADAAGVLKAVIDSGLYQLDRRNGDDSYEKLFWVGGEYSPETIFCMMALADKYTTVRYQYQYPECAYGGWHQFTAYNELVKDYFCADGKDIETSAMYDDNDPYANRDLRLYATVFLPPLGSYPGTKYNDLTYDCFKGPNTADSYNRYPLSNGYCIKKGCDPSVTSNIASTPTYTPLMRYAEVLLSYLEALNESAPGEVTQDVLNLTINDIRDRVKLPGYTKAELNSQEAVRKAVRKERRVELAFEGFRYFDVLRWGIAEQVLNHTFTGVKLSDNPNDRNYRGKGSTASSVDKNMYYQFETRSWAAHNRYFPIPQSEMNVDGNLIQNDGY